MIALPPTCDYAEVPQAFRADTVAYTFDPQSIRQGLPLTTLDEKLQLEELTIEVDVPSHQAVST